MKEGIIGNGDIASVLPERPGLLFFASGVSNSGETRESEYEREAVLLGNQDRNAHLVYFSSLSIFYKRSRYVDHKRQMEYFVRSKFDQHTIVRLGNITWGNNPHTLINYLRAHPEAKILDEYRYIVGKEEFLHWINMIPSWNCEMNIPGRMMKVVDVVKEYVEAKDYA